MSSIFIYSQWYQLKELMTCHRFCCPPVAKKCSYCRFKLITGNRTTASQLAVQSSCQLQEGSMLMLLMSEEMNCQSSLVSWARSLPLCPSINKYLNHHYLSAFTAGGVGISGVCLVATSPPAQSPGQKMVLEEGCLWCWAPVRSGW